MHEGPLVSTSGPRIITGRHVLSHRKKTIMTSICLYFKVHQPFQLKRYHSKDIDVLHCYEDTEADRATINKLADACYLPANKIMLSLIEQNKGKFKISYSISGTALELFQQYRTDVIDSFRKLVDTGCVEILAETHYHSL